MNYRFIGPAVVLVALTSLMNPHALAGPLDAYRDQNRLIVASVPDAAARAALAATLAAQRAGLDERDMKVIDVSPGSARTPGANRLDAKATAAIRARFALEKAGRRAVFILIGKDGGEKARQTGTLNLPPWFTLIDGMPMRRDEMRRQRQRED